MLHSIRLQKVRSHADSCLCFAPHVTVIHGKNGAGKTSVLEAINVLYQGKSFRGSVAELVQYDQPWLRIDGVIGTHERTFTYDRIDNKKKFTIDDKPSIRLPRHRYIPLVLFEPDDLRLVGGGPSRRRQYIDHLIEQVDLTYSRTLHRYERALQQRNKLLKQPSYSRDSLFAWNITLAGYGAAIIAARQQMILALNRRIQTVYRSIAGTLDTIELEYSLKRSIGQQQLLAQLEQSEARDVATGATTVGPHRHDIAINFCGQSARAVMSRGEIRTCVLALKFIELQHIESNTGYRPLFLLDDVFGELDDARKRNLSHTFATHQVIITTTEKIDNLPPDTRYESL